MQAVIVLAHKNVSQVIELAKLLRNKFEVYVHFDGKIQLTNGQEHEMDSWEIHHYSFVKVNWGAWSIVQATLLMMKEVAKNTKVSYVHVISGQDWPVCQLDDIYRFYQGNNHIYIDINPAQGIKKSGEPIINWQKYYFDYDKLNRKSLYGKIFHRFSMIAQSVARVDKFRRYGFDGVLYTGSQWVDLPIDVVNYLIDTAQSNSDLMKIFRRGFCSDEFWMQTIIGNNEQFRDRIVNNNHRFIKWKKQHDSYPAILDERDYNEIIGSGAHFARKFDLKYSQKLVSILKINNFV